MNKTIKMLSFIIISFAIIIGFTACGNKALDKIYLKSNSFDTTVYVGDTVSFDNAIIVLKNEDGSTEEIKGDHKDLKFSTIDTSKIGKQTLEITYKDKTAKVEIKVLPKDYKGYTVTAIEKPQNYIDFLSNRTPIEDNPETEIIESDFGFQKGDSIFKVGVQNAFVFQPTISAFDSKGKPATLLGGVLSMNIKVELKQDTTYTDITNDASYIQKIDAKYSSVQFTNKAIGKEFKMSVLPFGEDEEDPISIEFLVVDAYNVYNAKELSVLNNAKSADIVGGYNHYAFATSICDAWQDFRQANGVNPTNIDIHGLVLQNDMKITEDLVPEIYFEKIGQSKRTLKNNVALYNVKVPANTTFGFYGNYFNINTQEMPFIHAEKLSETGSDSHVIGFGGGSHVRLEYQQGNVYMENFSSNGNAPKSNKEEKDPALTKNGGLCFLLASYKDITIENSKGNSYLTFLQLNPSYVRGQKDNRDVTSHINNCNFVDCYSNMIFLYGVNHNFVKDCNFRRAGGPLIMAVDKANELTEKGYSNVEIQNSQLDNPITGQEAWFATTGASQAVQQLVGLNSYISSANKGKTMVTKTVKDNNIDIPFVNLQVLICTGKYASPSARMAQGVVTFKDKDGNITNIVSANKPALESEQDKFNEILSATKGMGIPVFQSSQQSLERQNGILSHAIPYDEENNLGYVDPQKGAQKLIGSPLEKTFFQGNQLNIYINGGSMAAVCEYKDAKIVQPEENK